MKFVLRPYLQLNSYLLSQKPNVISFGHTLASGAMLGYVTAHISNNFLNVFSPAAYL